MRSHDLLQLADRPGNGCCGNTGVTIRAPSFCRSTLAAYTLSRIIGSSMLAGWVTGEPPSRWPGGGKRFRGSRGCWEGAAHQEGRLQEFSRTNKLEHESIQQPIKRFPSVLFSAAVVRSQISCFRRRKIVPSTPHPPHVACLRPPRANIPLSDLMCFRCSERCFWL